MITNIIKDLIKKRPALATSTLSLSYEREDEIVVTTASGCVEFTIVISNIPISINSIDDWRKKTIANYIHTAANTDKTLSEIGDAINSIINTNVVFWKF